MVNGQLRTQVLQGRLMQDILEIMSDPYPDIRLHPHENDMYHACLILTPEGWPPLHLTVEFPPNYPLHPPRISIQSTIKHGNVFGNYICASILNTSEGYTPAYTFKGIAIQILSFFASDFLEQSHGYASNLNKYRKATAMLSQGHGYVCGICQFGTDSEAPDAAPTQQDPRLEEPSDAMAVDAAAGSADSCYIDRLPNELVLGVLDKLDFRNLTMFAQAWPRASSLLTTHNVIRNRELQCFTLKTNFNESLLGVGIECERGAIRSEFDLISRTAFDTLKVHRSIHNIRFDSWLPLPISHRHWSLARGEANSRLEKLGSQLSNKKCVLFNFMSDVVVRLNTDLENSGYYGKQHDMRKSTLRHASEKAIEAYFHLFHLLVCLALEDQSLVAMANEMVTDFANGNTTKDDCPNLGHLVVALLVSDVQSTPALRQAIVNEAIVRNVVWMLDVRGAGRAELSYLEPDKTSDYRLRETFLAGRTSYRLLMFQELFRQVTRPTPADDSPRPTLAQVREELFSRHGGPPPGLAPRLAAEVRRLQEIDGFPAFLQAMGLEAVTPRTFTHQLRDTVRTSMSRGYSRWALSEEDAIALRLRKEPKVGLATRFKHAAQRGRLGVPAVVPSFFPGKSNNNLRGRGRGGRGRGR